MDRDNFIINVYCIETVGSHLTERFHTAATRAHDLWHYDALA